MGLERAIVVLEDTLVIVTYVCWYLSRSFEFDRRAPIPQGFNMLGVCGWCSS